MTGLSLVRSLELLDEVEQILAVADLLENDGFIPVKRKKGNLENTFYIKDGVASVFCVIYRAKKREIFYTLIDYSDYKSILEEDTKIMLNVVQRACGDLKVVLRNTGFYNTPFHRVVVSSDGKQVDHKTHNALINTKDYLTACTSLENNRNKSCYCRVAGNSFSAPASLVTGISRIALCNAGFSINRGRIYSPKYSTVAEMYAALDKFETRYLGSFRYNPLIDFRDTWYALVVQKMLGSISDLELYEYNRTYMLNNHADIAQYYQLAI